MQKSIFRIHYQKVNGSGKNKLDTGSLKSDFKEYQEDAYKMYDELDILSKETIGNKTQYKDFESYMNNEKKMLDINTDDFWFSKNNMVKNYEEYISNLEKQIDEEPTKAKNYYGFISFTSKQLKEMDIDRNNMDLKDIKYMQSIVSNALYDLGKYHFKEENFNHISIFHNDKKHFHAHINFSSINNLDKIPKYRLARVHLKIAEGMIAKMDTFRINDNDFRSKDFEDEKLITYNETLKKIKDKKLSSFRYGYLQGNEKKFIKELYKKDIEKLFKNELNELKKQYEDMEKKYLEIGTTQREGGNVELRKNYEKQVSNYLKGKYKKELEKKETLIFNRILKDVKNLNYDIKDESEILDKDGNEISKKETKNIFRKMEKFISTEEEKSYNKVLEKKASKIDKYKNFKRSKTSFNLFSNTFKENEIDLSKLDNIKMKYMNQEEKEMLLENGDLSIS